MCRAHCHPGGCVGRLHSVPAEVGGDGKKSQLEAQEDLEVKARWVRDPRPSQISSLARWGAHGMRGRGSVRNRLKPPVPQEMRLGKELQAGNRTLQAWQRWGPPASLRGGGGTEGKGGSRSQQAAAEWTRGGEGRGAQGHIQGQLCKLPAQTLGCLPLPIPLALKTWLWALGQESRPRLQHQLPNPRRPWL